MTASRPALALLLCLPLAAPSAGCKRCSKEDTARDAAVLPSASAAVAPLPPKAEPLTFRELHSARGLGLPGRCRVELPVRVARVGDGALRFVAARSELGELALARGDDGGDGSRGLQDLRESRVRPLPWPELDAPPALDAAAGRWAAAWSQPAAGSEFAAVLWREDAPPRTLVEGDALEVVELSCRSDGCAVLTSLARRAATPGATVAFEDGRRVDVEPAADEPWRPAALSGVDVAKHAAWVAIATPTKTAVWRVEAGKAAERRRHQTPHGVYDVVGAGEPLVIAPGRDPKEPCAAEGFPIVVHAAGGSHTLHANAPPDGVIARSLGEGALVTWIGAESCRFAKRSIVTTVELDGSGKPVSSPMTVREASGFAVATAGRRISLWLLAEKELLWLDATCPPAPGDAG